MRVPEPPPESSNSSLHCTSFLVLNSPRNCTGRITAQNVAQELFWFTLFEILSFENQSEAPSAAAAVKLRGQRMDRPPSSTNLRRSLAEHVARDSIKLCSQPSSNAAYPAGIFTKWRKIPEKRRRTPKTDSFPTQRRSTQFISFRTKALFHCLAELMAEASDILRIRQEETTVFVLLQLPSEMPRFCRNKRFHALATISLQRTAADIAFAEFSALDSPNDNAKTSKLSKITSAVPSPPKYRACSRIPCSSCREKNERISNVD